MQRPEKKISGAASAPFPILPRRHPHRRLELPVEIGKVVIPAGQGKRGNLFICRRERFARGVEHVGHKDKQVACLHDYIKSLFDEAHKNGSPLLRAMFYEFPEDAKCWELQDQYMFGDKYLAVPKGHWRLTSTGGVFKGGQTVEAAAPIEYMPVFERIQG